MLTARLPRLSNENARDFVPRLRTSSPRQNPALLELRQSIGVFDESRQHQLYRRIEVAAEHAVAGFHAPDGRHRKIGRPGALPRAETIGTLSRSRIGEGRLGRFEYAGIAFP